jgi:hypothetical protein
MLDRTAMRLFAFGGQIELSISSQYVSLAILKYVRMMMNRAGLMEVISNTEQQG